MRQVALVRVLIAVLCGGTLILMVIIASGSEIDDTGGRAIATAAALAFFSLTGVAGSMLAARRPELRLLGHLTTAISVLALMAFLVSLWAETLDGDGWRPAAYSGILAFALGHASVLLASAREGEPETARAARAWTLGALALLVVLVFVEISQPGPDVGVQAIAVVAVLYVLGVLLIPLLRRGSGGSTRSAHPNAVGEGAALGLDHVVIGIGDRGRSNAFYRDVLGAEIVPLPGNRVAYRFGAQQLNPHGPGTAATPLAADPVRPGSSDVCLRWPGSAEAALAHLRSRGVAVVAGPVDREGAAGPGRSVYCRDPDGNLIELISYR